MWPLPSSGFDGSAGLSRPRAAASRSRKRTRRANGRIRKLGQRVRRPHHRPDPADVGERDQQRRLRLHAAQAAASPRLRPWWRRRPFRPWPAGPRDARRDRHRAAPAAARARPPRDPRDMASRRHSPASSASTFGARSEQALQRLASGAAPDLRQPFGDAGLRRLAVRQPWRIGDRPRRASSRPFRRLAGFGCLLRRGPGHALFIPAR